MNFHGFQKLTLLDFPEKTACTLFTAGCNFRCPFCHNSPLVLGGEETELHTEEEILTYLKKRVGILDGVAITGGEPMMEKGLGDFLSKVKNMGFAVKVDTNGSFPDRLAHLIECGVVDYVAMDVKNSKEKYAATVGLSHFDLTPIEESVKMLINGKIDFEFRTTVLAEYHEVADIEAISKWIEGAPKYFLQNFVDSGNLIGQNLHALPTETLKEMQKVAEKRLKSVVLRGV